MNIDEAIKELDKIPECCLYAVGFDARRAAQLGIEALKRCQYIAEHTDRWAGVLLPGETES